jgi:CheY-like chemotaxis protein
VRVLIVEHEEELRMLLAEQFRQRGVEVSEAANEFEALWQSKHQQPDVILIDLTLPEFGGLPVKRMRVFSTESLPIN